MKVVKAKIGNVRFVVNSKGKRVTPKYSFVSEYKYGPFYLAVCHDYWEVRRIKPGRVYVFDAESEMKIDIGHVTVHEIVGENIFAFKIDGMWHFYDEKRNLLRNDVKCFEKCKKYPYIIARIDEKYYFLDENMKVITDSFISATDFDEYGYSIIQDDITNRYIVMDEEFCAFPILGIECNELKPLSKDFFRIRRNGSYGIIDKEGKEILPVLYQDILTCGTNHFRLKYNNKYGLADITGKIIFECFYDEIIETPDKFVVKDFAKIELPKLKEIKKHKEE